MDNYTAAIQAAQTGVAIYDRSHWGRIKIADSDRVRFLHNQSTNDIQGLKPNQGCDTVFVTSTARTIDLVTVYVTKDALLLLTSPNRRQFLMEWLDRYIFFADKVQLTDITNDTACFTLLGAQSEQIIQELGATSIINQPYGSHISVEQVLIAVGSGLALPGYTLILPVEQKENLWSKILAIDPVIIDESAWEMLRILQGRPAPEKELTDDYNPLEVGLWQAISFNKGCYIGQETIARLNTYKGVKQHLWGIRLHAKAQPDTIITLNDEKIGKITSITEITDGYFGLGYIRTKAGGVGLQVKVGDTEGEIVEVPFICHNYLENGE